MFPVEPMTQPMLLPIQGEAAAVAIPWEREEGDLGSWEGRLPGAPLMCFNSLSFSLYFWAAWASWHPPWRYPS